MRATTSTFVGMMLFATGAKKIVNIKERCTFAASLVEL